MILNPIDRSTRPVTNRWGEIEQLTLLVYMFRFAPGDPANQRDEDETVREISLGLSRRDPQGIVVAVDPITELIGGQSLKKGFRIAYRNMVTFSQGAVRLAADVGSGAAQVVSSSVSAAAGVVFAGFGAAFKGIKDAMGSWFWVMVAILILLVAFAIYYFIFR